MKRTIIFTGANNGIGLAMTQSLPDENDQTKRDNRMVVP